MKLKNAEENCNIPDNRGQGTLCALSRYVADIRQYPLLTATEEKELGRRIQKGDKEALHQMIVSNLRLVVSIARNFENLGLPLLDLISEGNLGLMQAAERFNPAFGTKFSTYAVWWIEQHLCRALTQQTRIIRIPSHIVEKSIKIRRVEAKLQAQLEREPTEAEVAEEMQLPEETIHAIKTAYHPIVPLEKPLGEDSHQTIADVIEDTKAKDPAHMAGRSISIDLLNHMLRDLPDREHQILRERFGLGGNREKTLEEVGAQHHITRERARQLQDRALKRLRKQMLSIENNGLRKWNQPKGINLRSANYVECE